MKHPTLKVIFYLLIINLVLINISCRLQKSDEEIYQERFKKVPYEVHSSELLTPRPGEVVNIDGHFYIKELCDGNIYCWRHIKRCSVCLGY